MISPSSITQIVSAFFTVDSRCAITSVVRDWLNAASACCTSLSDSASSALVASSSNRIGALRRMAPGECDPLPLPAGKPHAAIPDHGSVALRQFLDELVRGGGLGGGFDVLLAAPRRPSAMLASMVSSNR